MRSDRIHQHHCSIFGVEATSAATAHVFPRHTHDRFGIGVMHRGGQRSHSHLGLVEAGPGDVIMVNPGEVHDGSPVDQAGRVWRMLYFDPALLTAEADDAFCAGGGQIHLTRPVARDARLVDFFKRFFASATGTMANVPPLGQDEAATLLLTHVLRHHTTMRPARLQSAPIARARARIDDDPAGAVSLAELAATAGLSRFQVLRGFSRELGLTPHAYLVQRRLHRARAAIAAGAGLAETSVSCGFSDQSHLTRVFVRSFGVTPGAYAAAVRPQVARVAISFKSEPPRAR